MSKKHTVSLVEDHRDTAASLQKIINESSVFEFYKYYQDGESACREIPANPPEILVMDLELPGMDGISCIRTLRGKLPELKITVLTVFEDDAHILHSLEAGANGYLLKDTEPELLLAEMTVLRLGGAPMLPAVATRIMDKYFQPHSAGPSPEKGDAPSADIDLSPREREVLNLISLGFTYTDIAGELAISPHTVRRHIEKIYQKMNVHSRSEAIQRGRKNRLLS